MKPLLPALAGFVALLAVPFTAFAEEKTAVFAGGCFWCLESEFDSEPGVLATTSGYSGGTDTDPTYEEVSTGETGHLEVMQVRYDPAKVGYDRLLEIFWSNVDPLDPNGQFCDKGSQYVSAIFVASPDERQRAEASLAKVEGRVGRKVATAIRDSKPFYPAEEYHQDYYKKNPLRYRSYRSGCGRDERLKEVWGKEAAPH
jgi:peptide-methionine (S)-S-oxide reductase